MAPVTDSPAAEPRHLALRWTRRLSLSHRILAVNILPLMLLAGSFFYLDAARARLIEERMAQAAAETRLAGLLVARSTPADLPRTIADIGRITGVRLRIADGAGAQIADSWANAPAMIRFANPDEQSWQRRAAARMDDAIDFIVSARQIPAFRGFALTPPLQERAEIAIAPDRTHMISVVERIAPNRFLVTDRNVRDIRRLVRAERSRLGMIIGFAMLLSVLLSLFLARTIAQPLRLLAGAAARVRLGRAREVIVPRLPSRSDEIGLVARSLSDLNHALQQRIDSIESFAADVAHELKNPLASMRSAVEGLGDVKDTALRTRLLALLDDDVRRMDRLITDISELSRIDALIARSRFETFDAGAMVETLVEARNARRNDTRIEIAFARPKRGTALVRGDASRLARAVESLIDNAISFSPPGGVVRVAAARTGETVNISVQDDGPGVPEDRLDSIFDRFHSDRPAGEAFGTHSGLGLSIARTIVEAHDGTLEARARSKRKGGGWFVITLPGAAT